MGSTYDQQRAESLHRLEAEAKAQGEKVNLQLWVAIITLFTSIIAVIIAIIKP